MVASELRHSLEYPFDEDSEQKNWNCSSNYDASAQNVWNEVFNKYDKKILPSRDGVDVEVDLQMQKISEISEIDQSFSADLFFSQIWADPNLRFNHITKCFPNITLSDNLIDSIWYEYTFPFYSLYPMRVLRFF